MDFVVTIIKCPCPHGIWCFFKGQWAHSSEFPLILLEREASSRRFLEDCFLQRGLRLQPEIELASHNLLISLARIGLGVAGVTEELSLSGLNRGVVRKLHLAEEIPSRRVVLCTRRNTPPSAAAGRFMEMIRAHHGFDRPAEQDG